MPTDKVQQEMTEVEELDAPFPADLADKCS
jgi:hypothetical protein